MGNTMIFSAVNTKIRGLKNNLLRDSDYINLMKKTDLESQIEYLKENTIYKKELEMIEDISEIEDIEFVFRNHMISQYEKIATFLTDEYKDLFKALLVRYDIETLKNYIRAFERDDKFLNMDKYKLIKQKYYSFNIEKIINSSNLEELINALKGSIYYNILSPYQNEKDEKTIFYLEMNLDKLYFNNLYNKSKALKKEDRLIFQKVLGANEDLLNIEWIYRGKKFYSLSPEELINFTLSHGLIFKYENLKDFSYSDEKQFKDKILSTRYKFMFDSEKDIDLYMDRRIHRYLYYMFLKNFKTSAFDISLSIAFIHLLDYEAEDVISILEAKKYGLNNEEIEDYLIRKFKGSD